MLFQDYKKKIVSELQKKLGIKNPLALPYVEKIVINMRVPEGKESQEAIDQAAEDLKLISGQKPRVCRAKQAVAGFKLREGDPIGLKVTLRGKMMYDFLERFFSIVLPRLRDFHGLSSKKFDQGGNFNIGLKEQTVFPEIDIDKIKIIRGLQVTIVVKNADRDKSMVLLESLGLPFSKEKEINLKKNKQSLI